MPSKATAALVPLTRWQARHTPNAGGTSTTSAVSGLPSVAGGVRQAVTQVSKFSSGTTFTLNRIQAWAAPQNSAHSPKYSPGVLATNCIGLSCPGITSTLPLSWGTQNEWMTLLLVTWKRTSAPTGISASLAVTNGPASGLSGSAGISRYRNSHHHCLPMTSMSNLSDPCSAAACLKITCALGMN